MSNKVPIYIKKLNNDAILPTRGSEYAAGYDVYANLPQNVIIYPQETKKISTGLSIEVDKDYWIGVFARSGLATKQGLRPANCVGIIDSDYRGPVIVAIHNDSSQIQMIAPGERIGQLVLMPCYEWDMKEVNELSDTERADGGFGSTGMR